MVAHSIDNFVLWLVTPLAVIFLLSGLDDLAVDFAWLYAWVAERLTVSRRDARRIPDAPPRPIAVLVPLWQEHAVIARMLEHNLAAIRYPDFHIFAGIYANDSLTEEAVASISERYNNVHLAVCPHDGPTSKADCLNWIYQHVGLYEEQNGIAFEVIVTHDAEDLIHPEELRWINAYATHFGFIQIPVLALATPFWSFTHGVYCDEFAEYHTRDMVVRSSFGCFVPGSGVGTGYSREALEALARVSENRVFEPASLTEDYESGLRLYRLGCRQVFVPLTCLEPTVRDFVATREFFPTKWRTALAQRTRWVMGIALQGLGALRLGRNAQRNLLAVAGSQGLARQPARRPGQCGVSLRTGDSDVDAHDAARDRTHFGDADLSNDPYGNPHGMCGARLWIRVRARRAAASALRQYLERRRDGAGHRAVRECARYEDFRYLDQDGTLLPHAIRPAFAQTPAGRDTAGLGISERRGVASCSRGIAPRKRCSARSWWRTVNSVN